MLRKIENFFNKYSALKIGGVVLVLALLIAVLVMSSPFSLFKAILLFLFLLFTMDLISRYMTDRVEQFYYYRWIVATFIFCIVIFI